MNQQNLIFLAALTLTAFPASAQDGPRHANFINDSGRSRCTVEVVVDGVAEVEVRGENANLRTLSGQPAQWRRFDCTSPMPPNPGDVRFSGVDGRGRQTLVSEPRSGGPIVVRIEDPQGGADKYKFDVFWEGGGGPATQDRDRNRGFGRPVFAPDDAVRICRDAISQQAADRFRTRDIQFRRIAMDDNPGRNEWVTGMLQVAGRPDPIRFSCSVDFGSGRIRTAEIESRSDFRPPVEDANRAFGSCQRGVQDRLRNDGFDRVEFRSINAGDRPDRVNGSAMAYRRDGDAVPFEFSCAVEPRDGDLRSVDVRRR